MLLRAIAVAVLGLAVHGCAGPTIRIATDAAFPPFHMVDAQGHVTGYDIELARAVSLRAGYEPKVVVVPEFADLRPGLLDGRHELVAATTGITPQRQQHYLFTRPYFETCQAVLVRTGEGEPGSIAELAGRRLAASVGTTSVAAARGVRASSVVEVASAAVGIEALLEGTVDGYVADEFEAVALGRSTQGIRVLPEPAALERYGFVMAPDRTALKESLDTALRELEAEGIVDQLRARFGLKRPADWPIRW